jgi:UDP-N-acetylmuramoyl-L-alanyl-D-glutamate--2,6-diaminopimelate ligase
VSALPLSAILKDVVPAPEFGDRTVAGIAMDSRSVSDGDAFMACAGMRSHGLDWLDEAVRRGASVVLWESDDAHTSVTPPDGVVAVEVPGLTVHAGQIAARVFGDPSSSVRVIGVTGTNGKTSVTHIIAQALCALDRRCGVIGTLGNGFPGKLERTTHTTPDAATLQCLLASLRDAGATEVAMEVSSHALNQHRVGGVRFAIAAFTNLTRDHLDYHGDIASYAAAKRRLFESDGLEAAVICTDDPYGRDLVTQGFPGVRVTAVGAPGAREGQSRFVEIVESRAHPAGMHMVMESHDGTIGFETRLLGGFNATNLAVAAGVLLECGVPPTRLGPALASVATVPGRMEAFGGGQGRPLAIVDYAHTPDALAQVLSAARAHTPGRLVCVFGCGGDRDRGKRPMMAAVAAAWADRCIVTDDNPRGEDGDAIVADITAGFPSAADWQVQRDRRRAIQAAIADAREGDTVVVAGKGHEEFQHIGTDVLPFSDRAMVATLLTGAQR